MKKTYKRNAKKSYEPIISIITPFYNDGEYIEETAKSVLAQTFPLFEWIIVDDGSLEEHLKKLYDIKRMDKRIKVITTEKIEQGPAIVRDIGIRNTSKSSKYVVFLDADDLYDKTFLECCYWTLETHPKASWCYTDLVNFGAKNYLWRKWYNAEWEKKENLLAVSSCIRKDDLIEVGGFGIKEKKVYEDWYLWLKLIKAGKYPVRMNSLLTYYRQKAENSELKKTNAKNRVNAMKLVNSIKNEIIEPKEAVQFPKFDYNWDKVEDENKNIVKIKRVKDDKTHILMIIPWMITGGADRFNLDLISRMNKKKFEFTIITTLPARNEWRKKFEKHATIYDLTTFLEMKDWLSFINYIIYKNNIGLIFNSNSEFGYKMLPYLKAKNPEIPIVDYVHMEEWYWRNGGHSRDSSVVSNVIDKTFTCNENSRKIFIKNFKRRPKEVKTIYVGVDEKLFKRGDNLSLKRTDPFFKIGFICRIVNQKRPYLFLEVCKNLYKTRKDFKVIVAGDGALLEGFKKMVSKNKMSKIFKFIGKVDDTRPIYEMCDITVNTSIKEGIALTSFESIAMDVPVISSDVGGQKELITEDVGIIVPCLQKEEEILNYNYSKEEVQNYVDAINKVLDNIEYYKSNCRKNILKKFTTDKMVKNMEKELTKIVENPNEEKIQEGKQLSKDIDILKELISTYFIYSRSEYEWLVEEFNKKNVHINMEYDKKAKKRLNYENTFGYKIKHPIVVALRGIGAYNKLKRILKYGEI